AVRFKCDSSRRGAIAGGAVALLLLGHALEYARASRALAAVEQASEAALPPAATVLSIAVHQPPLPAACEPSASGPSLGVPTLRWFGLYRLLSGGGGRVNIFTTSPVRL